MSNSHDTSTFLLVDVKQAGSDLIEAAGIATGNIYVARSLPPYVVDDMEKYATRVLASVERYRRARLQQRDRLTREQYDELATPAQSERETNRG